MSKTLRIVLYIVSLVLAASVFFVMAFGVPGKGDETETSVEVDAADDGAGADGSAGLEDSDGSESGAQPDTTDVVNTSEDSASADNAATDSASQDSNASADSATTDADTTIIFTGDVLFGGSFTSNYDAKGIAGVLSDELLATLNDADILMINNEFPFSDRGTPMEGKQYTFECSTSYAKALSEMGVDVASLANNHTLDYGTEALSDTFDTMDSAGVLYAGAGETVERAEEVQVIDVNGKKYGFLAVSRVIPEASWKVEQQTPGLFSCYDDTRLMELIEEAKESCDYLAVYPHWGVEYDAYPQDYQTKIATDCIEAGADLVVGSHTHCLQGAAWIEGKPVIYSLGNFMFGREIDRSAILKVTVSSDGTATYAYIPIYAESGCTKIAASDKAASILNYLDSISSAAISDTGDIEK